MKNVQFAIANEVKQSHKPLIIKEIATAHMRLAMTGSEFFKALKCESFAELRFSPGSFIDDIPRDFADEETAPNFSGE